MISQRLLDRPVPSRERRQLLRALGGDRRRGGRRRASVFGVIIGTGTGGGIVVDRRVLTGANGWRASGDTTRSRPRATTNRPGPPCYCGRRGCIETFLSGPALARDYAEQRRSRRRAQEIAARAAAGEALRARGARTIRGAPGARARQRHQPARPGRHRARRRVVEYRAGCTSACRGSGARTSSPTRSRRGWRGPSMATRAASAARRGCGEPRSRD